MLERASLFVCRMRNGSTLCRHRSLSPISHSTNSEHYCSTSTLQVPSRSARPSPLLRRCRAGDVDAGRISFRRVISRISIQPWVRLESRWIGVNRLAPMQRRVQGRLASGRLGVDGFGASRAHFVADICARCGYCVLFMQ